MSSFTVQNYLNKAWDATCNAAQTVADAANEHPRITTAAALAAGVATTYLVAPQVFALSTTTTGWVTETTTPTILGKLLNPMNTATETSLRSMPLVGKLGTFGAFEAGSGVAGYGAHTVFAAGSNLIPAVVANKVPATVAAFGKALVGATAAKFAAAGAVAYSAYWAAKTVGVI